MEIGDSEKVGKWMIAQLRPSAGVTKRWEILEDNALTLLGSVSWWSPWRKYSFNPVSGTTFEPDCLRALADFCEKKTLARKAERSKTKPVGGLSEPLRMGFGGFDE